jgi:WD40 repeat protein
MKRVYLMVVAFGLLVPAALRAQDDPAEMRKRLEKLDPALLQKLMQEDPAAVARLLHDNTTEVTDLHYTPNGRQLFVAALDGTIRGLEMPSQKELFRVQAHKQGVYGLALSRDGKLLASAGGDYLARVWEVENVRELQTLRGHSKDVICVAFAPDGKTLASGGYDGTIRLWDLDSGKPQSVLKGHTHKVTHLAYSPDGKRLASAGVVPAETEMYRGSTQGDQVRLWDPIAGKLLRQLPARGERLAFANHRTLVVAGMFLDFLPPQAGGLVIGDHALHGGSRITVWDLEKDRQQLKVEHFWTALAVSADGRFFASGWGTRLHRGGMVVQASPAHGIYLWEMATGKEVLRLPVPENAATVLAIAPDFRQVAAGHLNGTVRSLSLAPSDSEPAGEKAPAAAEDLERHWLALAEGDARAAYRAMWALAGAGDRAVALLAERLQAEPATGSPAEPGRGRALHVLEQIGTSAAQKLLQRLARKNPGSRLAEDVEAAHRRVALRLCAGT